MVELRNWKSQLEQFEELINRCSSSAGTPKKPTGQKSFSDIALGPEFKIHDAIAALAAPADGFQAFREVLFMGICGWVTSPNDSTYAQLLMRHGALDYLFELEQRPDLRNLSSVQADFVARYLLAGQDFLTDIFYPLGGHLAFSASIAREYLQDWHLGQGDNIRRLATACWVLHFAEVNFSDKKKYHSISKQRAVAALTELNGGKSVRSALLQRWSDNRDSLALLYAASTIKHGDDTLLDAVLSSEVRAKHFLPMFGEWLGRARYFCDTVLNKLDTDEDDYRANLAPLESFEATKFRPLKFSAEKEGLIRGAFMLKKRESTKI